MPDTPTAPEFVAPGSPEAAPAAPPAPASPAAAPTPPAEDPAATIARLEASLKEARAEAGKERVNAKQSAADQARAELAQTIGKALGLVQGDEPADPVKLTEQLTTTAAEAKQAKVELAVYKAASAVSADPSALLDSRTFLEKVATLDPTDTAALTAAITEAVTSNPRLAAAARPASPTGLEPNPAQGASASPPLGLEAQIAAAKAAGDMKTAMRLKSAMALNTAN